MKKNGLVFGVAYSLGLLTTIGITGWRQPSSQPTVAPFISEEESCIVDSHVPGVCCDSAADTAAFTTAVATSSDRNETTPSIPVNSQFDGFIHGVPSAPSVGLAEGGSNEITFTLSTQLVPPFTTPQDGVISLAADRFIPVTAVTPRTITYNGVSTASNQFPVNVFTAIANPAAQSGTEEINLPSPTFQPTHLGLFQVFPQGTVLVGENGDVAKSATIVVTSDLTNVVLAELERAFEQIGQKETFESITGNGAACQKRPSKQSPEALELSAESLAPITCTDEEAKELSDKREQLIELVKSKADLLGKRLLEQEISQLQRDISNLNAARRLIDARMTLQKVIQEFPDSPAASLAKAMLVPDQSHPILQPIPDPNFRQAASDDEEIDDLVVPMRPKVGF